MKNIFVYIITCIIFLASSNTMLGGTLTYEKANQLYHNQQYAEALELYNQMIAEGVVNASVYYNAGNTYYKLNKMGWAVWCFEKAKQTQPNNSIVQENLVLALQKSNQKTTTGSQQTTLQMMQSLLQFHQQNTWAIGAFIFFFIAMFFLILKKLKAIHPFFIALRKLSWVFFIIYFVGTIGHYVFHKLYKYGIIVEDTILYNGPKEKGLNKATSNKGSKVQILSFWKGGVLNASKYKIKLANGNVVWVEASMLKIL
jgi:tetratricopeptide (TPR) repeat protein